MRNSKPMAYVDIAVGAVGARLRKLWCFVINSPNISFVTPQLAIGGTNKSNLIVANGINAVVDLVQEKLPSDISEKFGIAYSRVPVADTDAPSLEQIDQAVKWIGSKISAGQKVLVYCSLGRGRSPALASAYLIAEGQEPARAIELVKRKRRFVRLSKTQMAALKSYYKMKVRN